LQQLLSYSLCMLFCRHSLTGIMQTPGKWWLMYIGLLCYIRHGRWNGIRWIKIKYRSKQTLRLSHFTINILRNDISHRFAIAIYSGYLQWVLLLYIRNVFKNNRKREIILKITPIINFTHSDLLIMTLKNSHSLIKKYGSLLLLKILALAPGLSQMLTFYAQYLHWTWQSNTEYYQQYEVEWDV